MKNHEPVSFRDNTTRTLLCTFRLRFAILIIALVLALVFTNVKVRVDNVAIVSDRRWFDILPPK